MNRWTIESYRFISDFNPSEFKSLSRLSEPKFWLQPVAFPWDFHLRVFCGWRKKEIRLKRDKFSQQFNLCALKKWPWNEIFNTIEGAAGKGNCVSPLKSQSKLEKDNRAVKFACISQLRADNSKLSRAWESRCTGFDTRMRLSTHAYLQRQPRSLYMCEIWFAASCVGGYVSLY